ncbi:hypothetical protein BBJ28_00000340 [Nothophytophthora sp. Chile5]|nr:hypothetical protein BBJ28_00000340 [Nothophytophthora sp. Chile5]
MAPGVVVTSESVSPQSQDGELRPLRIRVVSTSTGSDGLEGAELSPSVSVSTEETAAGRGVKRPRREEAALFLEKTYELLERCPPELASWTSHGESFVVKQPSVFAERVIPAYFKHRKFSSFVRQLNLYGFRKVRAASVTGGDPNGDEDEGSYASASVASELSPKDWWEFRHERFLRGRRDLLCEIRRRSPSDARTSTVLGGVVAPVERAELEELRAEVSGLREEMQKLQKTNQQLAGVMQALLLRFNGGGEGTRDTSANRRQQEYVSASTATFTNSPSSAPTQHRPLPALALASPSPQLALLQLRQGLQAPPGTPSSGPRDCQTPRTPASGSFQLRPVQSLLANHLSPSARPSPSPRPRSTYMNSIPSNGGYSQQSSQLSWHQQRWFEAATQSQPSPRTTRSPLKRLRVETASCKAEPLVVGGLRSPEDVAVRQLSRIASEIRTELLACITARVTGFLRVHRDQHEPTREADADAVADAVGSDIRQQLALLHSSASSSEPVLLDSETTCMYRVEILKFISRELPRAVQDAVERRLPAPEKLKLRPAKDRSLLALLVQKAQKALERQMHTETASVAAGRR